MPAYRRCQLSYGFGVSKFIADVAYIVKGAVARGGRRCLRRGAVLRANGTEAGGNSISDSVSELQLWAVPCAWFGLIGQALPVGRGIRWQRFAILRAHGMEAGRNTVNMRLCLAVLRVRRGCTHRAPLVAQAQ